jgi:hypothetical protein
MSFILPLSHQTAPSVKALPFIAGSNFKQEGVCRIVALPIYIKKYLEAKEELWKFKYFTVQKYDLQKNPLKETRFLEHVITL